MEEHSCSLESRAGLKLALVRTSRLLLEFAVSLGLSHRCSC
jgi:hypothetical protein